MHKAAKFTNNFQDLLVIYKTFVRSKLEQSATVWHSSLSQGNVIDLERVQKSAVKIILKERYSDYESALLKLDLQSLYDRRELLCYKFVKKGIRLAQFKKLFPKNRSKHSMVKRNQGKFYVNNAKTERYKNSTIPFMQRLLNKYEANVKCSLKSLSSVSVPTNNATMNAWLSRREILIYNNNNNNVPVYL